MTALPSPFKRILLKQTTPLECVKSTRISRVFTITRSSMKRDKFHHTEKNRPVHRVCLFMCFAYIAVVFIVVLLWVCSEDVLSVSMLCIKYKQRTVPML